MISDLVSVVMPAYNAENYIKEALESVLRQTYQNFEVLVVDDASTDDTSVVVKEFKDVRIKLINHNTNSGPGAARNTAINAAQGKWIAILDADDKWHENRLEELTNILRDFDGRHFITDKVLLSLDTQAGMVHLPKVITINKAYGKPMQQTDIRIVDLHDYIKNECPPMNPIVPIKWIKDNHIKYNEYCRLGEDTEFYFHLFRTGMQLIYYPKSMYFYRITKGSLTKRADVAKDYIEVFDRLLQEDQFDKDARDYFTARLIKCSKELEVSQLLVTLRKRSYIIAISMVKNNPIVLIELIKRLPRWMEKKLRILCYNSKIRICYFKKD